MDAILTKHGKQRLKERAGVKGSAAEKTAQRALELGLKRDETRGRLYSWLTHIHCSHENANDLRVYNYKVFVFDEGRLVTVLDMPREHKNGYEISMKKKKAAQSKYTHSKPIQAGREIHMNAIRIFEKPEFGQIRTVEEKGKVLFCGSDVAKALGYTNPNKAINDHCRAITKRSTPISGKNQEINFVPEGDLYRLITHSQLPSAEQFERWVFDEVLPSIRQTGTYTAQTNPIPDFKRMESEAKLNNSRVRVSSEYRKMADNPDVPKEYKQILIGKAAEALAGSPVLPLPEVTRRTYTATEIGQMFGTTANKIGHLANDNGLKTSKYGVEVWDKSPNSAKQVAAWRYYDTAIPMFARLLGADVTAKTIGL